MAERKYIAIDLKSFYASVECVERDLDPLTTNLVVADESRTEKTICLAVSPALKSYGIPGRARLFEVVQKVREVNAALRRKAPGEKLEGESTDINEISSNPSLGVNYIVAEPRMALYMEYSTKIYRIYLQFVAAEDIHVYSIDEVFIDVTKYLGTYGMSAHDLAMKMMWEVLRQTGITATAGIGTNLYLCKVAMDIVAKRIPADKDGVRIAELDEMSYRRQLWTHEPITDFWRVGKGYANRLAAYGIMTMGEIAMYSLRNEELLYKLCGVNAELLIDHAWGWEPCTIADIKSYKPSANSISSGQVLKCPYTFEKARLVVREMTELLVLDLVEKCLTTDQMVLTIGYDIECLANPKIRASYHGDIETDYYGRAVPKSAHGSINLKRRCSSTKIISEAVMELFDRIVDKRLLVRRMYVVANRVMDAGTVIEEKPVQLDLFTDYTAKETERAAEDAALEKEHNIQEAILSIQKKFGKNALLKGMNMEEGATTVERNNQIGGHKK